MRADIWAVGVILFVMLTGHLPFRGKDKSDRIVAMLTRPPTPIAHYRPDIDPKIAGVLLRCLAKNPDDRYATAGELARAIVSATTEATSVSQTTRDMGSTFDSARPVSRASGVTRCPTI